jgi:hypothetical protein
LAAAVMTLHARKITALLYHQKNQTIVDKVSFNPGSKKTFILFILTKNKVAKQQLQTIKITKRKI